MKDVRHNEEPHQTIRFNPDGRPQSIQQRHFIQNPSNRCIEHRRRPSPRGQEAPRLARVAGAGGTRAGRVRDLSVTRLHA